MIDGLLWPVAITNKDTNGPSLIDYNDCNMNPKDEDDNQLQDHPAKTTTNVTEDDQKPQSTSR